MTRVKVAPSRQVVIPKRFWDSLHLKPGDLLDVEMDQEKHSLTFTLKDVVDKTDAARKKWVKGLIKTGSDRRVELEEDDIVSDKTVKSQLFKEKYGPGFR